MAKRNKAKEEVTEVSKPEEVVSNKGENKEYTQSSKVPTMEDYENSELNKKAIETLVVGNPELQPEKKDEEKQPVEGTVKLHILSDDRLNSLINKANELGITDVIQIISSDKYGQFYMIYRA